MNLKDICFMLDKFVKFCNEENGHFINFSTDSQASNCVFQGTLLRYVEGNYQGYQIAFPEF